MKHDTVNWSETFYTGSREIVSIPQCPYPSNRYDLPTALRIVRRMETSEGRGAAFEEIKDKNLLYRLVDTLYSYAGIIQPLLLFAYMIKSITSVGPFSANNAEAVAVSNFANEHHTVARVAALVPDVTILALSMKRRHIFAPGQLIAAARMIGSVGRLMSFLAMLTRSYSFMPSARIASALAFYMRFSQLFAERPNLCAAIIPSNYSPEALGMAAAAHRMGRRVIHADHAPVPANSAVVPPVLADCALFYGEASRQTYQRRSRCTAQVALIGQPATSRRMEWRVEVKTVGIFLTAGTRTDVLLHLVSAISASWPAVRILIRNHPVALLRNDLSQLEANGPNIKVTIGNPLDDEIESCDLIVCGNSGVALNAVSGGRPVAYMDTLDRGVFDYIGFVENGLIYEMTNWSDDIYNRLRQFYERPEWLAIIRSYDASYQADGDRLKQAAADMILRYVRPMTGTTFDRCSASSDNNVFGLSEGGRKALVIQ